MVYHPTAYCPKCERLQRLDRTTLHSGEPFRVDNGGPVTLTTERAVHTTVMLRCRHHVTVVMSA